MAELTPLAISVLALLEERSMHAYEMYQLLITRHNDRLLKVRPGSLYHTVLPALPRCFVPAGLPVDRTC